MYSGCIHGGDNPNRICSHCETQIDIRPLPGMKIDDLREDLNRVLGKLLPESSGLSLT